MIKVSDYIAQRLKNKFKVQDVFLISGGGAMHLNNSFGKHFNYICNHHEQAGSFAAEGYARIKDFSVVNVTTGPGGLNCLNAVFGQWTDSVPVLYISGQVKSSTMIKSCKEINLRQLGDQEVDIVSVVKHITKYAVVITDPHEVQYHLDKAIYEATHGRKGPVWLDIPMDVQSALIDENLLKPFDCSVENLYTSCLSSDNEEDFKIDEIVYKLENATKPLIVVGHGIRLSQQCDLFLQFLNKSNIPIVTTFNGFDIVPTDHKNNIGTIGTIGRSSGNIALQNADVVLFLGTRNNIRQVSYDFKNFAKNAFKIIIDIDEAELKKPTIVPDLSVCADLNIFLPKLLHRLNPILDINDWNDFCNTQKQKYSFHNIAAYQQHHDEINIYNFAHILTTCMDDYDVLVMANASAFICPFQAGVVKQNQRFISNSGCASMGYGLPAAIGACVANNYNRVICLEGDGSIMMNLQELQTMLQYKLPIKLFVLNNGGYASIAQTQKKFFDGELTACGVNSGVTLPNFTYIAQAFGMNTMKISSPITIKDDILEAFSSPNAVLCDVFVKNDYVFTPKTSSKLLPDGSMISEFK